MTRDERHTIDAARALLASTGPAEPPDGLAERAAAAAIATTPAPRAPSFIDRLIPIAWPTAALAAAAAIVLLVLTTRTADRTAADDTYDDPVGQLTSDTSYIDPTGGLLGGDQ
jgi:hypothetical protein